MMMSNTPLIDPPASPVPADPPRPTPRLLIDMVMTVDHSPATEPPYRHRRAIVLALWLAGATAVFTALWAIACAMVGAQWHGQGTTFTPPTTQGKPQAGGNSHGSG